MSENHKALAVIMTVNLAALYYLADRSFELGLAFAGMTALLLAAILVPDKI